jgi:hypothetical protein
VFSDAKPDPPIQYLVIPCCVYAISAAHWFRRGYTLET